MSKKITFSHPYIQILKNYPPYLSDERLLTEGRTGELDSLSGKRAVLDIDISIK